MFTNATVLLLLKPNQFYSILSSRGRLSLNFLSNISYYIFILSKQIFTLNQFC